MNILALYCGDEESIRHMIQRWQSLSKSDKRYVCLDDLAASYGVSANDLMQRLMRLAPDEISYQVFFLRMRHHNLIIGNLALALTDTPGASVARRQFLEYWGYSRFTSESENDYE